MKTPTTLLDFQGFMYTAASWRTHHGDFDGRVEYLIADNHPEVDYKLIMLGELNFEQCKGCYACIARGEDKCPLKDDRDLVVNEMLDAGLTP